jgi:uncharacterized protein YdeI (YjbR/CyaY-like superfamily)
MRKFPDNCTAFVNREKWRAWLEEHHATEQEAWLLISRKRVSRRFLILQEAIEEALCFGWKVQKGLRPERSGFKPL